MLPGLFRLIWPHASWCSRCNKQLRERQRGICPRCGSTARIFARSTAEFMGARDKVN
jgi:rRNA maturation endonuclease Nob1